MSINGVFFDLVGTLLLYGDMSAELSEWHSEFYRCLQRHGLSISRKTFIECCNDIMIFEKESRKPEDGLTIFECRIQSLCSDLEISVTIKEIKDIANTLLSVWQKYLLLDPACISVLEALRQNKTLALISNFDHPPFVYDTVHKSGLEEFFKTIVVSGDVGTKKPDPEIFLLALQRTGLQPEEVVYVGDTEEDVSGAIAAGIIPILIKRVGSDRNSSQLEFRTDYPSTQTQPNAKSMTGIRTIASLPELIDMLE